MCSLILVFFLLTLRYRGGAPVRVHTHAVVLQGGLKNGPGRAGRPVTGRVAEPIWEETAGRSVLTLFPLMSFPQTRRWLCILDTAKGRVAGRARGSCDKLFLPPRGSLCDPRAVPGVGTLSRSLGHERQPLPAPERPLWAFVGRAR